MARIAKAYEHAQDAAAAVAALQEAGFDDVALASRADAGVGAIATRDEVGAATDANGGSLVVVNPPFGSAAAAVRILRRYGPGDTFEVVTRERMSDTETCPSDVPAPFSAMLGLPVLLNSAPHSSLAGPRTLSAMLGIPELTRNQRGHASLIDNPAPFSSLLGLPVLLGERRPEARR